MKQMMMNKLTMIAMLFLGAVAFAGCDADDHGHDAAPPAAAKSPADARAETETADAGDEPRGHAHDASEAHAHDHPAGEDHSHDGEEHHDHAITDPGEHDHDHPHDAAAHTDDDHDHAAEGDHDHAEENVIAIPPLVRRNLGITFIRAERRPVRSTLRIAGEFELRPEARREYHVMLPGRIELLVNQYERVKQSQPLFRLHSPEWLKMQSDLVAALNAMKRSHADVAVAEASLTELRKSIEFIERRVANLAEAQVRQVELEADLAEKRNALPRLEAELEAARMEFDAVHSRYDVMLGTASSLIGIPRYDLDPHVDDHGHMEGRRPPWRTIDVVTIRAEATGVVDRLPVTNQGWVETGDLVLDTIDPTMLRFHADALQTDINKFRDGQPALIAPPPGGSIDLQDTVSGEINVGFEAHPDQRTIPIFLVPKTLPGWAKAGVTAFLEVYIDGSDKPVPAIPEAAVVRDGLDRVFFKRDPHDPDQVIRVVADLGTSDNRWIEVKSGVRPGDEIVLGGVYPLMLASSSSGEMQQGGHFHADGTFHESDEH